MHRRNIRYESNTSSSNADAVFIGWQFTSWGEAFPLYNVTVAGHPQDGSTITLRELRRLHLRIPHTPPRPEPDSHVYH
jgi:hypothetical protein